jgi:hypothetical protein
VNRQVNLTKRVKTKSGLRYCLVVLAANGRIKPNYVLVDGKQEAHTEGAFCIAWIGRTSGSPLRLGIRRARGVRGGDPRLIHRHPNPMAADGPALRQPGRVHLGGPRQC